MNNNCIINIPELPFTRYNKYYNYDSSTRQYSPHENQHDWIVMLEYVKSSSKCELYNKIFQQACKTNNISLFDPLSILREDLEDEIIKTLKFKQKSIWNYIINKYNEECSLTFRNIIVKMWLKDTIDSFDSKLIDFDFCNKYYLKYNV